MVKSNVKLPKNVILKVCSPDTSRYLKKQQTLFPDYLLLRRNFHSHSSKMLHFPLDAERISNSGIELNL